jgi:hypothetical protein
MAQFVAPGSAPVDLPQIAPLALALAVVEALNQQFDAEVVSVDLLSPQWGEIRVRVRARQHF